MSGAAGFAPFALGVRRAALPVPRGFSVPDLDAPPPPAPVDDTAALAAAAEADLAACLQAARAEGYAEGEAAGRVQAADSRAVAEAMAQSAALARVAVALEEGLAAANRAAGEAAEALARLLLAALEAALPAAAARLAPESLAGFAAMLRPLLEEGLAVRLAVAPGGGAALAARIGDVRLVIEEDAALAPGDARASWSGGGAVLSLAERRGAVAEVLTALGLQEA